VIMIPKVYTVIICEKFTDFFENSKKQIIQASE